MLSPEERAKLAEAVAEIREDVRLLIELLQRRLDEHTAYEQARRRRLRRLSCGLLGR